MIVRLLRMDPALDGLRTAALVSFGLGMVLRIMGKELEEQTGFIDQSTAMWRVVQSSLTWSLIAGAMIGSKIWIKVPRFYMGLPISTRDMYRVRILGMALALCFVLTLTILASSLEMGAWGGSGISSRTLESGFVFWTTAMLATALIFRFEGTVRRPRFRASTIFLFVILWIGTLVAIVFLPWRWFTGLPIGVLALLLILEQDRRIPVAFDIELHEPDPDLVGPENSASASAVQTSSTSVSPSRPSSTSYLSTKTLLRLMHHHWQGYMFVSIMAIYGLAMVHDFLEGDNSRIYAIYTGLFSFSMLHNSLLRIHPVDALPISRRRIFLLAAAPGVLAVLLGGSLGRLTKSNDDAYVTIEADQIGVPHEFAVIASDGVVPETVAPWGETHIPHGFRLWPSHPAVLYNPYEFDEDRSPRFVRWLTMLAVQDIHGVTSPLPMNDEPSDSTFRCSGPVKESVGLGSETRSRTYAAAGMVLTMFVGILGCLSLQARNARNTLRTKRWTAAIGLVIPLGIFLYALGVHLAGWSEMWAVGAAPFVLLKLASGAVGGPPSIWWGGMAGVWLLTMIAVMEVFVRLEANNEIVQKKQLEDF